MKLLIWKGINQMVLTDEQLIYAKLCSVTVCLHCGNEHICDIDRTRLHQHLLDTIEHAQAELDRMKAFKPVCFSGISKTKCTYMAKNDKGEPYDACQQCHWSQYSNVT